MKTDEPAWRLQVELMRFLESNWEKPDEGIWEVRGGRKHFTHSKMMAWVAFDRAIKLAEVCNCAADHHIERWQKIRDQIFTLPKETLLCPGHGPLTTVAEEKAHNPFF